MSAINNYFEMNLRLIKTQDSNVGLLILRFGDYYLILLIGLISESDYPVGKKKTLV